MAGLLKVSSVARGCLVSGGEADAVETKNVNNDVVFAFEAEMGPASHSSGIGGGLMATTCPTCR